jgi:hypothetical protein
MWGNMKIRKILFFFLVLIFILGFLELFKGKPVLLADDDDEPPETSDVKILDISTSTVIIQWTTNEESDSVVNYGLDKNYGLARDAIYSKFHQIVITGLVPGTTHYFQVVSADPSGNQNISRGYQFTTERPVTEEIEGIEEIPSEKEKALIEESYEAMSEITLPESLLLLQDKLKELAEKLTEPPTIIGDPQLEIGTDYVIISWETDKESNSMVALALEEDYDPIKDDPYTWKEGDPEEMVMNHKVRITGLESATTYHYQVSSKAELGLAGKSEDRVFTTKSPLPEIYNIRIRKIEEESATLAWNTNLPCSSLIEYTDLSTNETKSIGDPNLVTDHSIQLTNLRFGISYTAVIKAEDALGQESISDPIRFTTVKDEAPPIISAINVESALYPGSESKIQSIIDWSVDELSICQVFYQEGLAQGAEKQSFPKETEYSLNHVQVSTVFSPATVYKFWIECEDRSENKGKSEDFTLLTPQQEKSILDIIIENFEQTFSWMKKIKL